MIPLPQRFIDEVTALLGTEFVTTKSEHLNMVSRTTLPLGTTPAGVAKPETREQIQQILRLATAHRVAIYPVSAGKNWGYGDACAPVSGCLILDLSRMNKIIEVNAELAYAVIEPGVTQGQLVDYLESNNLFMSVMVDGNGAGPQASFVGNVLERGFGHSAYGDRFLHSCNIEAVLADGTVVHTGFGDYPNAQAQHVYKHGVGPTLDGLFTQSNFAVVTRLTLWLLPKPEHFNFFFLGLKKDEAISPMVDILRRLRFAGTLRGTIHCFNDRRALSNLSRFPYNVADGKQSLDVAHPELMRTLYKQFNIPAWALTGVLEGSPDEVAAMRKKLRQSASTVEGLDRLIFFGPRAFRWIHRLTPWLRKFRRFQSSAAMLEKIDVSNNLLRGRPAVQTLEGAHWRARGNPGASKDPLNSNAGMIWVSPVLPMTGTAVRKLTALVEPIFHEFGFEYQVTLSCINDRALCAIMTISYDHASSDETERAARCRDKLLKELLKEGYIPYRISAEMADPIRQAAPDYWRVVGDLKKAWDVERIIAPGRYLSPE